MMCPKGPSLIKNLSDTWIKAIARRRPWLAKRHVIDIFCRTAVFNEIHVIGSDFSKINFFTLFNK